MTATLKLLRIEFRRNLGLLLFPLLVAVAWWMSGDYMSEVYVWLDTSVAVRYGVFFIGPLVGGISAWMAGRNRRRGMEEMLSITPRSSVSRDLITWAGTALWGIAAYVLLAAFLLTLTWWNATWGAPLWGYFLVGLVAMPAYSAIGYAAGYWLPSRFTAPLIAIGLFVAQWAPEATTEWKPSLELLSPVPFSILNSGTVFHEVPRVAVQQSLWLLGLAGLALVAIAIKSGRKTVMCWVALLGSVAVATVGLFASMGAARTLDVTFEKPVPFEPVCQESEITVCVHPAYEKLLPETAEEINRVAEPLVGLPGVPTRARQVNPYDPSGTGTGGDVLTFTIDAMKRGDAGWFKYEIATSLLWDENAQQEGATVAPEPTAEDLERCGRVLEPDPEQWGGEPPPDASRLGPAGEAMSVVEAWLLNRSGATAPAIFSRQQCSNFDTLVERFGELDPAERRAWLLENFADLRADKVTLKDLP